MIEEQLSLFAASFADKIINQDYSAAHSLLAEWLQPVISAIAIKQFTVDS